MTRRDNNVELLGMLVDAKEAENGIALEFSDPSEVKKYRQKLYEVRRQYPDFTDLSFIERGNELWIVKNVKESAGQPE